MRIENGAVLQYRECRPGVIRPKCAKYEGALLRRQFLASLETAASQHSLTSAAAHALHEAVHTATVTFLGLVGSLWHCYKSLKVLLSSQQYPLPRSFHNEIGAI